MKIYFNDLLVEKNRIIDDQWVKGNSGNKLEVYFEDNILESSAVNVRAVIEWSDGSTTNELILNKSIKRDFAYLNLPILKTDGEVKFTLKIYSNDSLQQTTLFSRKVYNSINASDEIHISSSEYESLLEAIESAGVDVDDQVKENTDNIETLLEAYEKGGLKYFDKVFAEDEIIDLFNINGNGKYSIKSALYGDEIVIVNVENQYVSRFNGNATLTYDFEKDEWVKQTGSIESEGNTDFELVKNKITRWESLANDNQYPSASLVKNGLDSKLEKEQGNDNAYKVAVTNRFGNIYFENKLPKVNMPEIEADDLPEIPKDKLPQITVDMLPSGAGIIAEIAEELRATGGNITGDDIKNKLQTLDDMTAIVECKHAIEITGNTGDEHGLAIEDQQVLIKKIQGQTIFKDDEFKHSDCNLISTGRNLWDEQWFKGHWSEVGTAVQGTNYISSKNYIPTLPNTNYASNHMYYWCFFDKDKNFIKRDNGMSITTPSNCYYVQCSAVDSYGTNYNNDIIVNFGATALEYEPYKEEVFVVNEELKAFDYIQDDKLVSASGFKTYNLNDVALVNNNYNYVQYFSIPKPIDYKGYNTWDNSPVICKYKHYTEDFNLDNANKVNTILSTPSGVGFWIGFPKGTTLEEAQAEINGMSIYYELATPTVTDLDIAGGYAVYKGGYQIQYGEVPYILTKEYSMSLKAQILANIEIDREQQEQLNEFKEEINNVYSAFDNIESDLETLNQSLTEQINYSENTFAKKSDITNQNEYGVYNIVLPNSRHLEINLANYKYWKGIIANTKGERVFVNGNKLNDEGNIVNFNDYLKNGSTLEYINGCLLVRREDDSYIEHIMTDSATDSKKHKINIVYDGTTGGQDDGFSIYWKGEK